MLIYTVQIVCQDFKSNIRVLYEVHFTLFVFNVAANTRVFH